MEYLPLRMPKTAVSCEMMVMVDPNVNRVLSREQQSEKKCSSQLYQSLETTDAMKNPVNQHWEGTTTLAPNESVSRGTNRLAHERSPYLLQHAHNPVDWYPWGQEAFDKAKKEDIPIFLSIGYSASHWCHVMEKESFEDQEVATLLNESMVCIKVDREERPDIHNVYMKACQMMTGSGGRPLTIIMTPEKKPFYASTYIPKDNMYGRIGMRKLIPRISAFWKNNKDMLAVAAQGLVGDLLRSEQKPPAVKGELGINEVEAAYDQLLDDFDEIWGGFGTTPKFPTPHKLTFLLRYHKRRKSGKALSMVEKTLSKMRLGGIYDQIGFGFHRYSVDEKWFLPHFEKMLYDQALLIVAYLEAYQATGKQIYIETAKETLTFVLRDMASPEGGFYSSIDADSEGKEGAFYLWNLQEVQSILNKEETDLVTRLFNIQKEGNIGRDSDPENEAANVPFQTKPIDEIASVLKLSSGDLKRQIEVARQKLLTARERRPHPGRDEKILTDWNGLMISALAKMAQITESVEYTESARHAADFILLKLRDSSGRLYHYYKDGEATVPGLLDDYAFLVAGLLDLYEATFDPQYLKAAVEINESMITHFWDEENGALFLTADDAETTLIRGKEFYDGAQPSGNSIAALNMLRLAHTTGNGEIEKKATMLMQAVYGTVHSAPCTHTQMLTAVDYAMGPTSEVVIVGTKDAEDTKRMLRTLRSNFIPNKVVLFKSNGEESNELESISEFTKLSNKEEKATAYVCRDRKCSFPTTDADQMLEQLDPDRFIRT